MALARTKSQPAKPDYIAMAKRLSRVLAERATEHDRAGTFPHDNIADLVESGYTAMTVPVELGGGGAGLSELVRAQEELAKGCGSTAFCINMHLHGIGILVEYGDAQADVAWAYREIVENGGIIAGGFSEPGVGGNWWYPTTTATPDGGDYLLNGFKGFFTGHPASTIHFLTACVEDERGLKQPVGFLMPRNDEGMTIVREWEACGMRGTGSRSLKLENLRVPARYMVGKPGDVPIVFMRSVHWAWCSFASCFVGIAAGALDYVIDVVKERKIAVIKKPLRHLPGVQFRVAEMRTKLEAARALLYRTADNEPEVDDPLGKYIEMSVMKMRVCELAHDVVTMALRVMGGSGYVANNPIQRMYRDVTAGLLLPPATDMTLEWAGKHALGVPVLAEPRWGE